jgi:hypothetical protein
MKKRIFEKNLPYYLLLIFMVILVMLAFLSEGSFGGADDISHFKYSRYAFKKPELFLDTWGKPLFTMLMAPFAQFGHNGVKVLNILLGLGAALLTFLTAKKLNYKYPVLALFLLVFAPLYTIVMISGLTEILFSFILILGIYLFFNNRSIWSCIVISLLPFVRTEGFIIFPSFLLAYILNRQWKAIPFVLTGFLFFSIIGSFHYGDFFWVINNNPYTGSAEAIYGSGELLHFVNKHRFIFGLPLFILVLTGLVYIPVYFFSSSKEKKYHFMNEVLVGFSPFFIYFAAHSYVWWQGLGNSGGSIKVMVAVFPSAVLLALFGWNGLMRWLPLSKYIKIALAVMLALLLALTTFRVHKFPVELGRTQQILKGAAKWLKGSAYADSKLYYWDPYWWFFLEIDPTDRDKILQYVPDPMHPQINIPTGALILWDAHFGPNEGQVKLNSLMDNPYFRLINVFRPDIPFQVLGGYDYEIFIFERTDGRQEKNNRIILEELLIKKATAYKDRMFAYFDFEDIGQPPDSLNISSKIVKSGSYSYQMNEINEYSPGIEIPIKDLNTTEETRISVTFSQYFNSSPHENSPSLVLSVQNKKKIFFYQAWEIRPVKLNEWEESSFEHALPEWKSPDDKLKIYIWNKGRQRFYIDDLTISLKEPLKDGLN